MLVRKMIIGLTLVAAALTPNALRAAAPDAGARDFADGQALLAKADFDGALKAYAAAAKADTANEEYRAQYSLLRQVIKMRERIDAEKNPEKWLSTAQGLHSFYLDHSIFTEALALERQMHAKLNTAESAAALASTELQMGMNAEAAELLGGLAEDAVTPQARALLGIALARQGKTEQARSVAEKCVLPADAGPGVLWDAARLRALLGDAGEAVKLLVRSFEATPPRHLDMAKQDTKESKDFASLLASAEFAKALETASKVKESGCSGGSSCGNCPSRGSCSSKGGHASEPNKK
jgi:tetratricopeptide (TPR) repeat protein